jgi:hypothetical protein
MFNYQDYQQLPQHQWPEILTRSQAFAKGLKNYFTGKTCKHGHVATRSVSNWRCNACKRAYTQSIEYTKSRILREMEAKELPDEFVSAVHTTLLIKREIRRREHKQE